MYKRLFQAIWPVLTIVCVSEGETGCVFGTGPQLTAKISGAKKDRVVWTSIDLGEQSPVTPATMDKQVGDPADWLLTTQEQVFHECE